MRGKYTTRYQAGTNLVRLDSDAAHAFSAEKAVNDTLRRLMREVPRHQVTWKRGAGTSGMSAFLRSNF